MAYQNVTPMLLAQSAVTTDYIAVYTVPENTRTYIKDITVMNTTGSTKHIYVSLVPDQGTPSASNALFYNTVLPGYTTLQWTGAQIMNVSDTIQIKADAVGCTVNITGGEAQ